MLLYEHMKALSRNWRNNAYFMQAISQARDQWQFVEVLMDLPMLRE